MTKFTTALIVALAAAFVPFGTAVSLCDPNSVVLGVDGSGTAKVADSNCNIFDSKSDGASNVCSGGYAGGTYVTCDPSGRQNPFLVKLSNGNAYSACQFKPGVCGLANSWCCA